MPVSKKYLYEQIDISKVETEARKAWEREYKRRQSLERVIIGFLPAGVVIMATIFFLLSAPHTQRILETITPGLAGLASPLALELGILIFSAFREAGWKSHLTKWILGILLFMSIFINVSGSVISVIERVGSSLETLTFQDILLQFTTLPITYQIVLVIAFPVGIIIPIMAKMVGESLIKLALGRIRLSTTDLEVIWQKEMSETMYRALLKGAIRHGATADIAGDWARIIAHQMYGLQNRSESPELPMVRPLPDAIGPQPALTPMQSIFSPQRVSLEEVETWMGQNEKRIANLSSREIARIYAKENGQSGEGPYKTVQRIKSKDKE